MGGHEADIRAFAAEAMTRLYRLALSVCRDERRAEDLLQTTMEKMVRAWPRLDKVEDHYAYARTVLINSYFTEHRRGWWHREVPMDVDHPDLMATVTGSRSEGEHPEHRIDVVVGLRRLPERQRLAVVLRLFEDPSVANTAALMRCSEGNVKRLTHDGLRQLRMHMSDAAETRAP